MAPNAQQLRVRVKQLNSIKQQAVSDCLKKWGVIISNAMKLESPVASGTLRNSIGFDVNPRSYRGVVTSITLIVGVYGQNSKAAHYIKYILYGSEPHFIDLHGPYNKEILKWLFQKNLIYTSIATRGKNKGQRVYRWVNDKTARSARRKKPGGMNAIVRYFRVDGWEKKDPHYFQRIANEFEWKLRQELMTILGD